MTDSEIHREIGRFLAVRAPLSPDISLNRAGSSFFHLMAKLELYGVADHPVVQIFIRNKIKAGMAHAIDHGAPYDHRVAHYIASKGYKDPLQAFILTSPDAGGSQTPDTSSPPSDRHSMEAVPIKPSGTDGG